MHSSSNTAADRWADGQAETIARLTDELRSAAAGLERGGRAGHARTSGGEGARTITIGLQEARALLRAIEPHQLSLGGRGGVTRRLVTSLADWWHRWTRLSLTPHWTELPAAIEAGVQLRLDLNDWIIAMRWHQATTRARVNWPQPTRDSGTIIDITRQSTAPGRNAPRTDRRRKAMTETSQRTLMLPIAGAPTPAAATGVAGDSTVAA